MYTSKLTSETLREDIRTCHPVLAYFCNPVIYRDQGTAVRPYSHKNIREMKCIAFDDYTSIIG